MSGGSPMSLTGTWFEPLQRTWLLILICWWNKKDKNRPQWFTFWVWGEIFSYCYCIVLQLPVLIWTIFFFFFDRKSSLTLATGLDCGTGRSQRVALLRKMKTGKGTSHLIVWWSGWRGMKTLMGDFVSLKHMLIILLFNNRLGSVFSWWKALAQWMWNAWWSPSSTASLPTIKTH